MKVRIGDLDCDLEVYNLGSITIRCNDYEIKYIASSILSPYGNEIDVSRLKYYYPRYLDNGDLIERLVSKEVDKYILKDDYYKFHNELAIALSSSELLENLKKTFTTRKKISEALKSRVNKVTYSTDDIISELREHYVVKRSLTTSLGNVDVYLIAKMKWVSYTIGFSMLVVSDSNIYYREADREYEFRNLVYSVLFENRLNELISKHRLHKIFDEEIDELMKTLNKYKQLNCDVCDELIRAITKYKLIYT